MDWADELAASVDGPQVVNDSKTPSGTVHVGSLRGPVILDVDHPRAARPRRRDHAPLRRGRHGLDGRAGAPDARCRGALHGGAAGPHPATRPATATRRYARHHAQTFIDVFAGLGIHPDRYYWMSDIYPHGRRWTRSSGRPSTAPPWCATSTVGSANVQHPEHWLPLGVVCPSCGKVGTTHRVRLGRRDGVGRLPPGPGELGRGLRLDGPDRAVRRHREAALEPRVGGPVEPVRRHDRAQRQGPGDGRRLTRPVRRHRREVFDREPPLNFPYEFLNIGGRKMSTSKGAGAAAHMIGQVMPPEQLRFLFVRNRPETAHRVRPGGYGRRPASVRRVRPARGRHRRPRGQGRAPAGPRLASSGTRCSTRPRTSRRPRTHSGPPSATWPCSSRSRAWTSTPALPPRRALR